MPQKSIPQNNLLKIVVRTYNDSLVNPIVISENFLQPLIILLQVRQDLPHANIH